ncbi:MAG TPA: two-component regulator propeller domain-containing protein [Candidatus Wallbacteria bacterium]|nr:two-component regulator propeller domain-containing protein [Candidatus Wallbacteria bacterium]
MSKKTAISILKLSYSAMIFIAAALLLSQPRTSCAFEAHHDIRNYVFEIFGTDRGLPSDFVTAVTPVPGDSSSVLVGTWNGIVTFDGLIFHDFAKSTRIEGESPKNVTSLYYDAKGDLWIGTMFYENAGLFKFSNGQFTRYSVADGLPSNNVTCIAGGPDALFLGTWGGGLVSCEGDKFNIINKSKGLSDNMISSVAYDPNSRVLWAGTKYSGANSIRDSKIEIMDDHTSQLINNNVHMIAIDSAQNTVYFGTSGGYSK